MERTKTNRYEILDIMKGFAMLMTIFCYAEQRAMGNICTNAIIWQLVHWWHMPLFFILSGFFAANSPKLGTFGFIKSKFHRLIYV